MQDLTLNMELALRMQTAADQTSVFRQPVQLYEVYPADHYPAPGEKFDPANALFLFADADIVWLGRQYREQVLSRGEISRHITAEFNGVNVTFANADRYMSGFVLNNDVEGLRLVVRYIDRQWSTTLADSVPMYVGRLGETDELDGEECSIPSKQDLGSIAHEIPRRKFSRDDPFGRSPNNPLFEGIRFQVNQGVSYYSEKVDKRFLIFFTKKKSVLRSLQWSSQDNIHDGETMPYIFGRCQMELVNIVAQDEGYYVIGVYVAAGHKIWAITEVKCQTEGFSIVAQGTPHLGDPGGTGTNATLVDRFGSVGYLSKTAYLDIAFRGSAPDVVDPAPVATAILLGEADLPDGAGVFNVKGFTDNPAYLARRVLIDPDAIGLDPSLIDDEECIKTARLCDEIIRDRTNGEVLALAAVDAAAMAAGSIRRFRSGALVNPAWWRYQRDPLSFDSPHIIPLDDPIDVGDDFDLVPSLIAPITYYRRRFTYNAPLTNKVKAIDFLSNSLGTAARLWVSPGPDGRHRIRMERPADHTFLRPGGVAGDRVKVWDVEPWGESLKGELLVGAGSVLGEVRKVVAVHFTADGDDFDIAIDSTGPTVSVTPFAGGDDDTQSSAVITIELGAWEVSEGVQVVVTIDGVEVAYTTSNDDDAGTIPAMVAAAINAEPKLNWYMRAAWSEADQSHITVYPKIGELELDSALANAHTDLLASPTDPPVLSSIPASGLPAGDYQLAYSYQTATGETFVSPRATVTNIAGRRIRIQPIAMPLGVDSLNWYMSKGPGDTELAFLTSNNGGLFHATAVPTHLGGPEPTFNNAGEELLRVMFNFTKDNIRAGKFKWPLASNSSAINQVVIKYREAVEGFAEKELYVNDYQHQLQIGKVNSVEIDGSGVDSYNQALRLAYARLAKERDANFFVDWSTDEAGIPYEEGDVGCVTDDTGLTCQPVRIENLSISDDLDVSFHSRIYSSHLYADIVGQKRIAVSSPLKYINQPPPPASDVVLSEGHLVSANQTWISTILGTFTFGDFPAGQIAHVYILYEGEPDYVKVDTVLPDQDSHGRFEVVGVPRTVVVPHQVKIVTESRFGPSEGLAAATANGIEINGPPPLPMPDPFDCFFDDPEGDALLAWNGTQQDADSQEAHELRITETSGGLVLRTQTIKPSLNRSLQEYMVWDEPHALLPFPMGAVNANATRIGLGGIDFTDQAVLHSLASAECVGGLLAEWQAPEDGIPMPTYLSLFPDWSYDFSLDDAFIWQCVQPFWDPTVWYMFPEGFHGTPDFDQYGVKLKSGNRYGVYIRPDGVAEYTLNYSPSSRPVYTSGRPVDQSALYRASCRYNGGAGIVGVRKASWLRQGAEWKYVAAAIRHDNGLDSADPLPADVFAEVRQLSPYANGTHSPWNVKTFSR